jgi:hypothetical protein
VAIKVDSIAKRTAGNRVWIIGAIDIRAEMNFALIAKVI